MMLSLASYSNAGKSSSGATKKKSFYFRRICIFFFCFVSPYFDSVVEELLESTESVESLRGAFMRSLCLVLTMHIQKQQHQVQLYILLRAILKGAFPASAACLDLELDALVVAQAGGSSRGGCGGSRGCRGSRRHFWEGESVAVVKSF